MGCGASKSKKTKSKQDPQPTETQDTSNTVTVVDSNATSSSTSANVSSQQDDTGVLAKSDTDTGTTTSPPISSPEPAVASSAPGASTTQTRGGSKGQSTDPDLPLSPLRPLDTVPRSGPTQLQPLTASPLPGTAGTGPVTNSGGARTPLGAIGGSRPLRPSPLSGIATTSPPKDGKKDDGNDTSTTTDADTSLSPDAWSRARQRRRSVGGPLSNPLLNSSMQADSVGGGHNPAFMKPPGGGANLARVSSDAVPAANNDSGEPSIPSPKHREHSHQAHSAGTNAARARLGRIEHTGYGDIDGIGTIRPRAALAPITR